MSKCPCGSELEYKECCEVYHLGSKTPETAEKLMRARYSAFAKNQIKFISESHKPGTTDFNEKEATDWATSSTWKKLEIVKTEQGQENQTNGVVEFKAHYVDRDKKDIVHHEIATFSKAEDKWFYDEGQIVGHQPLTRATEKVGRNEPCPCGSGKKFKKCCGAN